MNLIYVYKNNCLMCELEWSKKEIFINRMKDINETEIY